MSRFVLRTARMEGCLSTNLRRLQGGPTARFTLTRRHVACPRKVGVAGYGGLPLHILESGPRALDAPFDRKTPAAFRTVPAMRPQVGEIDATPNLASICAWATPNPT